jgi:hypothetical protein
LKRLLEYLGRQAIADPEGELKEYTVGVEAFGKAADYEPQTDSSVRVQAGKLRQKLDEYYRTEGVNDDLRIELPKGQFKLEFRQSGAAPPAASAAHSRWPWPALAALVLVAAALSAWGLKPAAPTATEQLWKPFLSGQRPVMIVIGTPMFVKLGNAFFRDPALNNWEATADSESLKAVDRAVGGGAVSPAFPYTGVGDAAGAFALERLLVQHGKDPTLQVSNLLPWEDIARYNVIFLGPPKFNLQTADLPVRQDFEIGHSRVQNLHPNPGEPRSFEEKWTPDRTRLEEGHALISRLPGLHRAGELLILAGSSTECTRAAAEYMTRAEYAEPFMKWMREQPGGIPEWFQVVVRARFKSQTPIAIERVAFHALK